MEKTITGHSFKQFDEPIQVSGFSMEDTYEEVLRRGVKVLYPEKKHFKSASIVVTQGRVPNVPSKDGKEWTLGGYLYDIGNYARKGRLKFGIYVPEEQSDVSYKPFFKDYAVKLNLG